MSTSSAESQDPDAGVNPAPPGAGAAAGAEFPCLDGMRALAALAVFTAHASGFFYFHAGHTWAPAIVQSLLSPLGGFGVAIFFVLSGFLLYRPFVLAHFRGRPTARVGPFWLRRFVRIFPAYWVMITVCLFVLDVLDANTFSDFVTYYALALNYRAGFAFFGIGVEWTLVIEVSFYLALPLLAFALRSIVRPGAGLGTKVRVQVVGLLAIAAASMLLRAWDLWIFEPAPAKTGSWFPIAGMSQWLVSYLDWFAAGMLMAVISAWVATGGRLPRILDLLARYSWVSWLLAAGFYASITRLYVPWYGVDAVTPFQEFMRLELSLVAAAFLVIPAVFGDQTRGAIRDGLSSRPMVALGLISYGIYLWHVPLFDSAHLWGISGGFPSNAFVQGALVFGLTLAAATVSYFIIERPTRRWAQRVTRRQLPIAEGTPSIR